MKKRKSSLKKTRKVDDSQINIVSAIELDADILKQIKNIFGDEKQMNVRLDESIVGGVIIENGDKLFDGSIRHQLQKLSQFIKS